MTLYVWDTVGSPLFIAAASLESANIQALPINWGESILTLHYGRGASKLQVDSLPDNSAVLIGPWVDLNPEVLAGKMDADTEYIVSERLALLGSAQYFLRRQCLVLNPLWQWTGGTAVQNPADQRSMLRKVGFMVAPEILSNDRDELLHWQSRLTRRNARAMPGQLTGIDGLLPTTDVLDVGVPFIPRRYLARRSSHDLRVLTVVMGRTYAAAQSDEGSAEPVLLEPGTAMARKAVDLANILETKVCEILLEGSAGFTRAMAISRTLGLLTPPHQLSYILGQLITILSEESQ